MGRCALCWNFCFLCRVSLIPCVRAMHTLWFHRPPFFSNFSIFFFVFCLVLDIIPMVFSNYSAVLRPEVHLGFTIGQSRKKMCATSVWYLC